MDKEYLLTQFMKNYLSRQEVLYRLPLNQPISAFWSELMSRRRTGATLLPLHNAAGRPCWFNLTDKMIAASETLAEEMLRQGEISPRIDMTSGMTKEMFFTSLLEGAQVGFDDSMEFLESGREPENINEQMILNNRSAWEWLVQNAYHAIDEEFCTTLAGMLTEGMENTAEGYREVNTHQISAMNGERYTVPSFAMLRSLMDEYYSFLRSPEVHPLIKAAVAQAYILITRPFPEGNERLSRMISSAVLMRSGYGFVRDIALSETIAVESHVYYKAMQDILREENDGDLTYFVEYYVCMLARALEKSQQQETELQEVEHQLTVMPIPFEQPADDRLAAPAGESSEPDVMPVIDELRGLTSNKHPTQNNIIARIISFGLAGNMPFSVNDLIEATGSPRKTIGGICRMLVSRQFIIPHKFKSALTYTVNTEYAPEEEGLLSYLEKMENSTSAKDKRIGTFLLSCVRSDRMSFTGLDYAEASGQIRDRANNDIRVAVNLGLIRRKEPVSNMESAEYTIEPHPILGVNLRGLTVSQRENLMGLFTAFGYATFTVKDYAGLFGQSGATAAYHLENFEQRGLIRQFKHPGSASRFTIAIKPEDYPELTA